MYDDQYYNQGEEEDLEKPEFGAGAYTRPLFSST